MAELADATDVRIVQCRTKNVGSSPALCTIKIRWPFGRKGSSPFTPTNTLKLNSGGSWLAGRPHKPISRHGSESHPRAQYSKVSQLVERQIHILLVMGSFPVLATMYEICENIDMVRVIYLIVE